MNTHTQQLVDLFSFFSCFCFYICNFLHGETPQTVVTRFIKSLWFVGSFVMILKPSRGCGIFAHFLFYFCSKPWVSEWVSVHSRESCRLLRLLFMVLVFIHATKEVASFSSLHPPPPPPPPPYKTTGVRWPTGAQANRHPHRTHNFYNEGARFSFYSFSFLFFF